jgi:heme-degrading monooxygenase HmoA
MIIRIVQMTFQEGKSLEFLEVFKASADLIRQFPGCIHLELWESVESPDIYFTYSLWVTSEALNHYRFSDLFKETWSKTKILFSTPPVVWSMRQAWISGKG